jgi:hypothetical protein
MPRNPASLYVTFSLSTENFSRKIHGKFPLLHGKPFQTIPIPQKISPAKSQQIKLS